MPLSDIENLTEAQREVLRLVLTRHSSKEIAQKLGISPFSVDKRIERAIATLGATSRFDAARRLAEHEGALAYEPLAYEAIDLSPPPGDAPSPLTTEPGGLGRRLFGLSDRRITGEARNTLTGLQRVGLILALMVGIAIATGSLINVAAALADTMLKHHIDLSR